MDEVFKPNEEQTAPARTTALLCPLTPALRQTVVVWISHSLPDDAQLAKLLFLSPETVRTHWKRIHEKLGTHSKAELLFVVLQSGWETLPPAPCPLPPAGALNLWAKIASRKNDRICGLDAPSKVALQWNNRNQAGGSRPERKSRMTEHKAVWRVLVAGLALLGLLMVGPLQTAQASWVWEGVDAVESSGNEYSYNGGFFEHNSQGGHLQHAGTAARVRQGGSPSYPAPDDQASQCEHSSSLTHHWSYNGSDGAGDPEWLTVNAVWSVSGNAFIFPNVGGDAFSATVVALSGYPLDFEMSWTEGALDVWFGVPYEHAETNQVSIRRSLGANGAACSIESWSFASGWGSYYKTGYKTGDSPEYNAKAVADIYINTNPL